MNAKEYLRTDSARRIEILRSHRRIRDCLLAVAAFATIGVMGAWIDSPGQFHLLTVGAFVFWLAAVHWHGEIRVLELADQLSPGAPDDGDGRGPVGVAGTDSSRRD